MTNRLMLALVFLSLAAWSNATRAEAQQTTPKGDDIDCDFTLPVAGEYPLPGWTGDCVDGYAEGNGLLMYADGMVDDATFEKGLPNGDWVERSALGDTFVGQYLKGKRHGRWRLEYANGKLSVGEYAGGNRHGHWTEHHQEDGYAAEGMYMSELRHGRWVFEFHKDQESGSREEITFALDVRNGPVNIVRQQGRERTKGQYRNGESDGLWVVTIDGDVQGERRYEAGVLNGKYRNYVNGNLSFWEVGFYERGVKQGEWIEDQTGKATGIYVNGKRQGEWKRQNVEYHDQEVLTINEVGSYFDGEQQGMWVTTRETDYDYTYGCRGSSFQKWRIPYESGRRHGDSLRYFIDRSSDCKEGNLQSCDVIHWDQGVSGKRRSERMRRCKKELDIR